MGGPFCCSEKVSLEWRHAIEGDRGDRRVGAHRQKIDRVAYRKTEQQLVGTSTIENICTVASRAGEDHRGMAAVARRADRIR
jgi:hypothetical protein